MKAIFRCKFQRQTEARWNLFLAAVLLFIFVHFLALTNSKLPLIERGTSFFSRDGTNVSEPYSITNYGLKRDMLACPSDSSRRDGIYQKKSNSEITDTNISYFIDLDASLRKTNTILAGDRNLQADANNQARIVYRYAKCHFELV